MKKLLLLGASALLAVSANAQVSKETNVYSANGVSMTNVWSATDNCNTDEAAYLELMDGKLNGSGAFRSMVVVDGVIYLPEFNNADGASLYKVDAATGESLEELALTDADGNFWTGYATCITKDDFGHVYLYGGAATVDPMVIYSVDLATGVCTQALSLPKGDPEDALCRVDHISVCGDVTGVEANGSVVAVSTNVVSKIYGWQIFMGDEAFDGLYGSGQYNWVVDGTTVIPEGQLTGFGTSAHAVIMPDTDEIKATAGTDMDNTYLAANIVVDSQGMFPLQYDPYNKKMVGGYAASNTGAGNDDKSQGNANAFFHVNGKAYHLYESSIWLGHATEAGSCHFQVAELPADLSLADATDLFTFPKGGMANTTDGSTTKNASFKGLCAAVEAADGQSADLYICVPTAGIAKYTIKAGATGVEETLANDNAPVEYYNLQGVKVANPENGLFIKKQGNKAVKVVL